MRGSGRRRRGRSRSGWWPARCDGVPTRPSYRVIAERLSARALEAARRQADNLTLLAMVREQGEIAMARGDRKGAEASWGRLLDLIMPAPPPERAGPSLAGGSPVPAGRPHRH